MNTSYSALRNILFTLVFLLSGANQAASDPNLLLHYEFESLSSLATDSSTYSNHGIVKPGVEWLDDPERGGVLQILKKDASGNPQFNDSLGYHIEAPVPSIPASTFTISAWVKVNEFNPTSTGNMGIFVFQGTSGTPATSSSEKVIGGWANGHSFGVWGRVVSSSGVKHSLPFAGAVLSSGQNASWHHVVYTGDGALFKLYIDGVLISSVAYGGTLSAHQNLFVGIQGNEIWNGWIDDLRVYASALSEDDVTDLGSGGEDEGSNATVWSANGHGYEMVYANGLTWAEANAEAQSKGGHLVSVNSAEENTFLVDNVLPCMPCAGTEHCPQSQGNNFIWHGHESYSQWSTGEPVTYTNWSRGEPNGDGPTAHFWDRGNNTWQWNDYRGNPARVIGYVVEYSESSGGSAEPQPHSCNAQSPGPIDSDGDGLPDDEDELPNDPSNGPLGDRDGDGVLNQDDNCPDDNGNGNVGADGCPLDTDGDGVNDDVDNCPAVANPVQADLDGDGIGDACDDDIDGDGVGNNSDDCPVSDTDATVDGSGCSIDDYCPCEGARNHGQHQSCVAQAAKDFHKLGLITKHEESDLKRAAAKSSCGQ